MQSESASTQTPTRIAQRRRYLMCRPEHFTVSYRINPWMEPANPTDTARAVSQWQTLYDTYRELGHEVELIDPIEGLPSKDNPKLTKEEKKALKQKQKEEEKRKKEEVKKKKAKKGRRPAQFKEKEFQIILDNLRQNNRQDTELDLQNHYLDKWAAEDLAEVLMENRTVKMLNLSHNLIGDDGTAQPLHLLH